MVIKHAGALPQNDLLLQNEHELHFVPLFVCSAACTEAHVLTLCADNVTAVQISRLVRSYVAKTNGCEYALGFNKGQVLLLFWESICSPEPKMK